MRLVGGVAHAGQQVGGEGSAGWGIATRPPRPHRTDTVVELAGELGGDGRSAGCSSRHTEGADVSYNFANLSMPISRTWPGI